MNLITQKYIVLVEFLLLILLFLLVLPPVFAQVPSTIIAEDSISQAFICDSINIIDTLKAQDFDSFRVIYWRWSDPQIDHWFAYDKLTHFVGFSWQYLFLQKTGMFKDKEVLFTSSVSALLWECKDALVPWEVFGEWGGDGFSYKDLIWSLSGIGISYWINK